MGHVSQTLPPSQKDVFNSGLSNGFSALKTFPGPLPGLGTFGGNGICLSPIGMDASGSRRTLCWEDGSESGRDGGWVLLWLNVGPVRMKELGILVLLVGKFHPILFHPIPPQSSCGPDQTGEPKMCIVGPGVRW